eukprot:Em0023g459a
MASEYRAVVESVKPKVVTSVGKKRAAVQLSVQRKLNSTFHNTTTYQLVQEGKIEGLKMIAAAHNLTLKGFDSDGRTLLHASAISNQCEMMDYLISCGNDLNAVDNNGDTALHLAVTNRHIEATKVLLSHGADDTILNKQSDAPLHIAARNDHGAMVTAMLEYPIDVTVRGLRNRIPMHVIAENDSIEVLKVFHNFIASNKDNNSSFRLCAKDADDLTPIHLAARKGSHRVLQSMIDCTKDHGYTADQVLRFLDEENNTPLHTAVDGGYDEVVRVLLSCGASPTESKMNQLPPMHLACSQGKLKMVELMVQFGGVDVIACRDAFGQTPLHSSTLPPSTAVLCYLLNIGAQLNACNNQGQTPLITATLSGNLAAVKTLLKSGADPLIKDQNGDNPLHYAVQRNRKAIATCLLDHSVAQQMLIQTNHSGSSPVHHALLQGSSDLASQMFRLLEGTLYEHRDSQGCNYLHLAALGGDWKTLTAILSTPICPTFLNETNDKGSTPLHLATAGGNQHCVEILLSHGAMTHKCSCGFTPFMLACARGHDECAKVLYNAHPFQKNWSNDEGNNALHLAALAGSPACISLALDIGVPITCNNKQDGFLDIIIDRVDSESALAVIQHDRWNECLQFKSPLHPYPMVGLIEKLPDVAKAVLDRCHTKSLLPRDHLDYWESYNFEPLKIIKENYQAPKSGASVISSYTFLLSAVIRGHEGTLWTAGSLAVFFGWFGVALELSLFDLFGIYVMMFLHVTRTLFMVLFLCIPFLLAFGLAIYIVGSGDPNFSTIAYSLFTLSSYLLGQIDYGQFILDESNGALLNAPLVFVLVILVAIILAIAFSNLLVGLAVGDIGQIRQSAMVHRQASRISTLTHLERAMPQCLKLKFNFVDLKVYPNKKASFLQQMWRYCWRAIKNENPEDEGSASEGTADNQTKAEGSPEKRLLQINQQVEEMAARQERMLELIQQLHQSRIDTTYT